MKPPQRPPDFLELLAELGTPEQLATLLPQAAVARPHARVQYLHWDQLRHRPPPQGLTTRAWWFLIKLNRQAMYSQVPLVDGEGQPFHYAMPDPVFRSLVEIDRGAGGRIEIPEAITNPETKNRYYISSLMEEAITSSQLEGATTTRQVAKNMIRSGRPPVDRSERMILNNYRTMQRIAEVKHEPLTPELVLEIHRTVTDGTLDDASAAGRLRRSNEDVFVGDDYGEVFHVPPPAGELVDRIERMCAFANGETPEDFLHGTLRSIILHFWLAYDHPFVDGNGRTARALFYWSMLRQGAWLFEFVSISTAILKTRVQYGKAFLHTETDDNDLTYFIVYHLKVIQRAMEELHEYLARKAAQTADLQSTIKATSHFNHRQRALLNHALRHPGFEYSFKSHQTSHDIVYQTARTDLLTLEALGLLIKGRAGRRMVFVATPNLAESLQQ